VTRGLIEYEIDGTIYSVTPIQAVPIEKKIERKARERLIKKAAITRRPKGDTPLGAQAQRELVNPGKAGATAGLAGGAAGLGAGAGAASALTGGPGAAAGGMGPGLGAAQALAAPSITPAVPGAISPVAGGAVGGGGQSGLSGALSSLGSKLGLTGGETGLSGEALSPELIQALGTPEYGLDAGVTLVPMGEGQVGQVSAAAAPTGGGPPAPVPVGKGLASASGLPTSDVGAGDYARWAKRASDLMPQEEEERAPPPVVMPSEAPPRPPLQPIDVGFAEFLARIKDRGMGRAGIIGIESFGR